jgi:hypothetical protein
MASSGCARPSGERAAEAAAGLRRGQLGQLQPAHFAQQPQLHLMAEPLEQRHDGLASGRE